MVERPDHHQRIVGGAIAHHQRQVAIGAVIFPDLLALGIDDEGDAIDAPARHRHFFDDLDGHVARIALADADALHRVERGDALARRLDIEADARGVRLDAQRVEDLLFAGQRLAGDGDFADGKARIGELALGQVPQRQRPCPDMVAHLIEPGERHQHEGDGEAAHEQAPVHAPRRGRND